jgi:hypothetical protein
MADYRIFLRNRTGIVGREEIATDTVEEARAVAEMLCDACSDLCDEFELWQGSRLLCINRVGPPRPSVTLATIEKKRQEAAVLVEERLQQSQWAVAKSKRLLECYNRMKTAP